MLHFYFQCLCKSCQKLSSMVRLLQNLGKRGDVRTFISCKSLSVYSMMQFNMLHYLAMGYGIIYANLNAFYVCNGNNGFKEYIFERI